MTFARSLQAFLRRRGAVLAAVLLALAAAWMTSAIYFSYDAVLRHYGAVLPLSSDNVAPYLLFDDLFRRHLPFAGWRFPEAPFYLPDIALGWLVYVLAGSLVGTIELYALVSATLFLLLACFVLRRAGYGEAAWPAFVVLWVVGCAAGVRAPPSAISHLYGYVFMPYIHSGMLLGVLAGLALLLRASVPSRATVTLIALLSLAMLVSDRLFVLQFIVPASIVCAGSRDLRRFAAPLVALVVASELARVLLGATFSTEANDRTPIVVSLQAFGADLSTFVHNDPLNAVLIVSSLVATVFALRAREPLRRRLALFAAISALLPVAAVLLLGRYHSFEELRYFQSAELLLLPLAGTLADFTERRVPRFAAAALCVTAGGVIVAAAAASRTDRAALGTYLVDQSTCLGAAVVREHLGLGAATYWRANEMTARFPDGPVLIPLSTDIGPRMRNIVNLGWLDLSAPDATLRPLDFVDEDGYAGADLDRVFGPATRRLACPRSSYRLYAPADGALAHLYRAADWLPSQLIERVGVARVPAAAWAATPRFAAGDAVDAAGSFATSTPVLATALDVPRGAIELELGYAFRARSQGARVRWQVAILDDAGAQIAELGAGELAPSLAPARFAMPLAARPDAGRVLAIALAAEGDLELHVTDVRIAVR